MKKAKTTIPAMLALLFAGCVSVLPESKKAAPRYDVALPDAPATTAEAIPPGSEGIVVVGKVRASDAASGRLIRTADVETGRTGYLTDGELALSTEAVVGAFLRSRLAAVRPDAIVCDASVAPHSGARTTVDAWIERFRLEKSEGAWYFKAAIRIISVAPDGSVSVTDATPSVPVLTNGGARPTAEEATRAISSALASIDL